MASDLRLTVLGSATPYPDAGNPCSGYLVEGGGARLWVDAGSGTLGALQRHARLDEIDAVWISHLHADHCADLLTAFYGLLYADVRRERPLPLYGPPGIADRLADFLTSGDRRSPVEDAFEIRELSDGHGARIGALDLAAREVAHGMPAFALRVEHEGHSLVYSGDSAPCPALTELATGCGTLLCEADGDSADGVHHAPEDAGKTAAAAGAGRLIVTHVGRGIAPGDAVTRAATTFPGPVAWAAPGAVFPLG